MHKIKRILSREIIKKLEKGRVKRLQVDLQEIRTVNRL